MPLSTEAINQIAQTFLSTEAENAPMKQASLDYPNFAPEDGYRVQRAVIKALIEQGYKVVGKKAGATSAGAQQTLGITEPLYGILLDLYQVSPGASVAAGPLIRPALECEIAFKMKQELRGPDVIADDVLAATESVVAAFEIADLRTHDFKPSPAEAIGVNVFARGFVLGDTPVAPDQLDLPNVKLTLTKNGEQVQTGIGSAVLGHPAEAVAWVVNKLAQHNLSIEAGEIVLSGALAAPYPIKAGDKFEAVLEGLGSVAVEFV